ncbi:hypothetical protein WMF27_03350 [Sorangium sp. So ce281]|uniref:hypothetical protein n=1 Tax=Sorangium sp. So ce281 TaxID=3133293 RepID=UPI003F62FD3B
MSGAPLLPEGRRALRLGRAIKVTRLRAWVEAVQARPAVRAIQNPVEFYVERFAKFVKPATTAA